MVNADVDIAGARKQVELEEKQQHSQEVLDLQHTPKILSAKVDAVKEENMKLKSENQVQGQYIENFTSSSRFFQISDTKNKEKKEIPFTNGLTVARPTHRPHVYSPKVLFQLIVYEDAEQIVGNFIITLHILKYKC
ncbi:short coiled-coil protein B-like [Mustela putorius furo]|uniref:Short coiled-coil protein B-like n=1 Tax=Mustela putorius furo TaxID=9669 RepID=A0A8U0RDK0_MUSPF|nr:short coiled-coil protein B-like [Mustela putorius furo]